LESGSITEEATYIKLPSKRRFETKEISLVLNLRILNILLQAWDSDLTKKPKKLLGVSGAT
jgi:hypothetical protein